MSGYLINFGLSSSINQEDLIQKLKNLGADVIQTSSGLCFRPNTIDEKFESALKEFSDLKFIPASASDESLSPDVRAFLKS